MRKLYVYLNLGCRVTVARKVCGESGNSILPSQLTYFRCTTLEPYSTDFDKEYAYRRCSFIKKQIQMALR